MRWLSNIGILVKIVLASMPLLLVLVVMLGMVLGRLVAMLRRMQAVGVRQVGVVTGLVVVVLAVMLGGRAMMFGGFLASAVVLGWLMYPFPL